jgi:hypothetical protein
MRRASRFSAFTSLQCRIFPAQNSGAKLARRVRARVAGVSDEGSVEGFV